MAQQGGLRDTPASYGRSRVLVHANEEFEGHKPEKNGIEQMDPSSVTSPSIQTGKGPNPPHTSRMSPETQLGDAVSFRSPQWGLYLLSQDLVAGREQGSHRTTVVWRDNSDAATLRLEEAAVL